MNFNPLNGGSTVLGNVGILRHHYTVSQPSEDIGSTVLRNVGILRHHYTVSSPRRLRLNPLSSWKPQTSHLWYCCYVVFSNEHLTRSELNIRIGSDRIRILVIFIKQIWVYAPVLCRIPCTVVWTETARTDIQRFLWCGFITACIFLISKIIRRTWRNALCYSVTKALGKECSVLQSYY